MMQQDMAQPTTALELPVPEIVQGRVLAPLTTMGVGGPADAYLECATVEELRDGLSMARAGNIPVLILGGGSNVLISDEGFRGLVIRPLLREMTVLDSPKTRNCREDFVILRVGAGEPWDAVVAHAVNAGLAGLEALSGIPGLAGASPIQNIGAYGQEVGQIIECVEVLDRETGLVERLHPEACGFAYRDSRFKTGPDAGRFVVLAVEFRLLPTDRAPARYGELRSRLSSAGYDPDQAPLQAIRDTVLALRRSKGMVVDLDDPDSRSCGSFFTNPLIPTKDWPGLVDRWRREGRLGQAEEPPCFDAGPDRIKVSAAWLIERAGYPKGYAIPNARPGTAALSTKHCLAITNRGQALAREIRELAEEIQRGVRQIMGVDLVPEPVYVGL
jgi:UDP-N-acetylmuramate dehydrogenase